MKKKKKKKKLKSMQKFSTNTNHLITSKSTKLLKLRYLLQNSKIFKTKTLPFPLVCSKTENSITKLTASSGIDLSKDFSLYFSLIKKPLNLLFSIDQFLFEFSKKKYQQKKTREFLQQLKERKKLSLFYGHLTRKQLVNLFQQVKQKKGFFPKIVFSLLERRLDVVLYRSGMTKTVKQARQLIKHKKIQVNQNLLTIPSYRVNPGDLVSIVHQAGQIIKHKLLKLENLKWRKSSPKVFGDFYSKLEKIQDKPSNLKKTPPKSSKIVSTPCPPFFQMEMPFFVEKIEKMETAFLMNKKTTQIKSKMFCKLLAQLISTRILLRCFLELKKNYLITNSIKLSFSKSSNRLEKNQNSSNNHKKFHEKSIYTLLKGRSSKKKLLANKKHYHSKLKNYQLANLYAIKGSLQKKPQFWDLGQLFFDQKNKKNAFNYSNLERPVLKTYRTGFLTFFKFLKKDARFQKLLLLSMKKSFSKKNPSLSKKFPFKSIKPLHLEISYNLLNIIYLYSPQRVTFPFFIDLDLINRSLR